MKLVLTTVVRDEPDVVDAHIAFHLAAGVDLVLAAAESRAESTESYNGRVQVIRSAADESDAELRTRLARQAATEHGADWVIDSGPREFWWPRAESLKEVLAPIPERYTVVQGLRRDFRSARDEGSFAERMTMRPSLEHAAPGRDATPVLRPIFRADPDVVLSQDGLDLRRNVPLRAWYPVEVLYFPAGAESGETDLELVEDTRLRDALRALRNGDTTFAFRAPDIVEDARYAVECAAVGEVNLPRLEEYVTELEQRIEWLEQRFWPRVLRRIARLAGRSS